MTAPDPAGEAIGPWHAVDAAQALRAMESTPAGLSSAEAAARLQRHGPNRLPREPGRPAWKRLLAQFDSVLIGVLLVAAAITLGLGHTLDATVILGVVAINAALGFLQEGRAEQALAAVGRLLAPRASVLRDGRRVTLDSEQLAPGDVVLLESGDHVPADLRLLQTHSLRIDEAALTGESVASGKDSTPVAGAAALGDRRCMAYAGTLVAAGQARGLVVATGSATELGRISGLLGRVHTLDTPLLRAMNRFSSRLAWVILGGCTLVLALSVALHGYKLDDAFLAVVGIAVAAIPEGLPVLITITLALGVQRMAARRAIVRRLPAVETLGSVGVICSDKTGTLTRNEMTVRAVATAGADFEVEGSGYGPHGAVRRRADAGPEPAAASGPHDARTLQALARVAWLCNDATLAHEGDGWRVEGDPMEGALRSFALKAGSDDPLAPAWTRLDVLPFDAAHRYMATLDATPGARWVHLKGAPERVLALCTHERRGEADALLAPAAWLQRIEALAAAGLRVLALAEAAVAPDLERLEQPLALRRLVLLGVVGLIDPPRDEARQAIAECGRAGIRVKMITGDHAGTAAAIARDLGLRTDAGVLTGAELDALDDAALRERARAVDVFARTSPEHKLRLVTALQADGSAVAMTGDGVNDAPALKRADIGVAMGIKGTEAAKQAAEIVLADDNFATIVAAVREGRAIHDNIRKSIQWTLPTNGGESLVILAALLFGLTLPITALQILWINMVTTVTLGLTFAFEPAEDDVMHRPPRPIGAALIDGHVLWRIGLVSALFAIAAFGMFRWAEQQALGHEYARTLVVNTIVVLEIFYLFSNRFLRRSSLDWRGVLGTPAVLGALAAITALQLLFTYAPLMQAAFGTRPVSLAHGLLVLGCGVALLTVLEAEKWLVRGWRRHRAGSRPT